MRNVRTAGRRCAYVGAVQISQSDPTATSQSSTEVATPVYGDELVVGTRYDLGSRTITEDEIIEFARQWDPQPFHTDRDVAAAGPFGRIIASGIHSIAIYTRMSVEVTRTWAVVAGKGLSDVRFLRPVFADTELRGVLTISDIVAQRPGRVEVIMTGELLAGDKPVVTIAFENVVSTRPASGPAVS